VFVASALLYPLVLAALCAGAGLLVDRFSGGFLPAPLLLSVGAGALIGVSQLSTYFSAIAPATPYVIAAVALIGFALAWGRAGRIALGLRLRPWPVVASVLAYAIALAPVLLAGRPSFSSYMTLSDSAVHMLGADFLIHHGQNYAHLDLRNSYGQFVNYYYNTSYPSGADTLFGASAVLLRLPLIWAFQPFNAFMLALAAGPAWVLARRIGLTGAWAAAAVLTAILPALVYAYELFGSVKEITALSMLLTLGALTVLHRRWLPGPPVRAAPFALVLAAGVSALGVAFGAWALAPVVVLAIVLARQLHGQRQRHARRRRHAQRQDHTQRQGPRTRDALALIGCAALVLVVAAWPTWVDLSGSLHVAETIASTSNSGNLSSPLRVVQVFGVWLRGSYKLSPAGAPLAATNVLIALVLVSALLGVVHLLRSCAYALAGWIALTLLASLAVGESVSAWADAKTLVLSSPLVVLLAWGGVAALIAPARVSKWRPAGAVLLALVLVGGVLASDALQYHSSDLAPTARYQELASVNSRFAGQGPTLFTDFDEYSLYELRDLDVGGPDFMYPPPSVAVAAGGYGHPVDLDRVSPAALLSYPLIVTRRDPAASRPPSAYELAWQGAYYQVWKRGPDAPAASVHVRLGGSLAGQCARIGAVAAQAHAGESLVAAESPQLIAVVLTRAPHPTRWGHQRKGLVMSTPGALSTSFVLPAAGRWDVWVQGEIMPAVTLSVDGRQLSSIAGQLSGNSLVPNTVPPAAVTLAAGQHRLSIARPGFTLAPGDGGAAVLHAVFLTPSRAAPQGTLRVAAPSRWQTLCGRSYQWIEAVRR
jgi:hypothetical protein